MNDVENEKPEMENPSAEYGLKQAVIDTNIAVQQLADMMAQLVSAISTIGGDSQ